MGGIVSCVDPTGSVTSTNLESSDEVVSSPPKHVQFHTAGLTETHFYQVLLLGFAATGKTALITRNAKQLFYKNYIPSVAEETFYTTQIVTTQDRREALVRVQVTDLPGSFLGRSHCKKSLCDLIRTHDGIIVAIDSTKSLDEVKREITKLCHMVDSCAAEQSDMKKEYTECQDQGRPKCLIIALTKVDVVSKQRVSLDEVQSFLDSSNVNRKIQRDIRLVETSALYGINIFVLFQNLVQMCHNCRTSGPSSLYDFWKHPIIAEAVLESWGISLYKRSYQQKTCKIAPTQWIDDSFKVARAQMHSNQQSKTVFNALEQPHQMNKQISMSISSPATMMDSPEQPLQSMKQDSNMDCLTIGNAMLDSCPAQVVSTPGGHKKPSVAQLLIPPKPLCVSNSNEDSIKASPTNKSPMTEERRDSMNCNSYAWSGIKEHRRSVSSVISMIEDKDSAKEPESCQEMERKLSSYREKMMEAKEKNQFALANVYKQEVIKCHLLLSETKNRQDRVTKLLNRNAFDEDLPVFEQICETKTPGLKGVIFAIDLMNFKLLNDEHGHGLGDRALKEFARELKRVAKDMLKVSGKAWNVYRVGGDEFAITALMRSSDRQLFRSAAQFLADIQIPWHDLVPECTSEALIFGRIGGVFGKYVKYEDADIIERNVKERNRCSRKTIMEPEKIERVMLYYLDVDDRNEVIAEYENEIQTAVNMREFRRCSEIQETIKFLREGFTALKKENQQDVKADTVLTRGDTHTTLYSTNAIQRLTKRSNLQEIFDFEESKVSESSVLCLDSSKVSDSSVRPVMIPESTEVTPSPPSFDFEEAKKNNDDADNEDEDEIGCRRGLGVDSPDGNQTDDPPPYCSESEKDGNENLCKPQPAHLARPSQSISDASGYSGTVQKIGGYKSSSTSDSQISQTPENAQQAGQVSPKV